MTQPESGQPSLWASLGEPSFLLVAGVINGALPLRVRTFLSSGHRELLARVVWLGWKQAVDKGQRVASCSPSLRYLSQACGRSPRTLTKYLAELRELKLVRTKRLFFHGPTKPKGVNWQGHNSYFLGDLLLAIFAKAVKTSPELANGAPARHGRKPRKTRGPQQDDLTQAWEQFVRTRKYRNKP